MGLQPERPNCRMPILQAWYPGQAGGTAIAEVLFGDYNPAGRLPITFYKKDNQLPDFEDYNMQGRTYRYLNYEPLYPFGHGLSYTTFSYSTPFIENGKLKVKVTNSGNYNGDEVIQLYIKRYDDPDGPLKTLRGSNVFTFLLVKHLKFLSLSHPIPLRGGIKIVILYTSTGKIQNFSWWNLRRKPIEIH